MSERDISTGHSYMPNSLMEKGIIVNPQIES